MDDPSRREGRRPGRMSGRHGWPGLRSSGQVAGLGSAYLLNPHHEITVYESTPRIGGHSRTVTVDYGGHAIAVDTGFIVFNKPNYPNLCGLFAHLGVPTHTSDMTFAASIRDGWLEWGARDLDAVVGQRRNLLRP